MGFASDFARCNGWKDKLHTGSLFARLLDDVLDAREILEGNSASIEETSFYFEDGQLAVARDSHRSDEGFCLQPMAATTVFLTITTMSAASCCTITENLF